MEGYCWMQKTGPRTSIDTLTGTIAVDTRREPSASSHLHIIACNSRHSMKQKYTKFP
jgi:hypothetical protein